MKEKILISLAALALLAACKGKSSGSYEFVNNSDSTKSEAGIVRRSVMMPAEKLVRTAEINLSVKNVSKTAEEVSALTSQFGGMVMHHQVQSTAGAVRNVHVSNDSIMRIVAFNTTGEMTIRVPSAKLEDFMTKVSHMGIYVNLNRMDIDDRSLDYLSAQLKLNDRQELVSQQRSGKIRIKNPADVLLLKDDMVDQKIENMRTDAAVKFSVISLGIYQSDSISKEIIANDDPSAYDIPLFQRVGLAFANGWSIFVEVMVGLINLWVFILAGIIIWRTVVYYRKRMHPNSNTTA